MKIINIEVNDLITIKNIEDTDAGTIKSVNSTFKIPTGNYQNVLLNFDFISPKIVNDMKIVASFRIDKKESIDIEITNINFNSKNYATACYIPPEVFVNPCKVLLGVYGFSLNKDESLKQRFSLIPVSEIVVKGSYNPDAKESIVPSPTIFEIYFNKIDKVKNDFESWVSKKEKQIDEAIASKFSYLHKYENYLTTIEKVTSIPIELDVEYRNLDIVQVKINGLDFIMGKNFTINNNEIHFANPVEPGNTIYYSIERYITTDINDFEILRGPKGINGKDGLGVPTGGKTGQVLAKKSDADNDTEWVEQTGGLASCGSLPVGAIIPFAGSALPDSSMMFCEHQELSRTEYSELFSIIGTTYGEGDGSTTFNLPNLKGKTVVGFDPGDNDFNILGKVSGEKTHKLAPSEIPNHTHSNGQTILTGKHEISGLAAGQAWADVGIGRGMTTAPLTGVDQPHNNLQPYIVLNYIIKVARTVS